MKKKLDTIHIHGMNFVIIFGLIMLYLISNKSLYTNKILALTKNISNNNDHYEMLNSKIQNISEKNKINVRVNEALLEKELIGMSAVIYDATEGKVVWSYNSVKTSSLASLTKVMTAYIYKENCDKEIIYNNLSFKSDDALRFMLIQSSNEMADALSTNCMTKSEFIKLMNEKAVSLGLNLHYVNPSGMDYPGIIGGRGDAMSMSQLLFIVSNKYPNVFDYTTENESELAVKRGGKLAYVEAINTNQDISNLTGARASKTGLTDYAGGNLGIVYDPFVGRTLSIVVLGSTKEGRFDDIKLILNNIYTQDTNI